MKVGFAMLITGLIVGLAAASLMADESAVGPRKSAEQQLGGISLDRGVVPDGLALTLLGSPDLQLIRPGSVETAIAELRGFMKEGKIVPGLAVEVTPWNLGLDETLSYADYRDRPWTRNFSRSSISFATTSERDDSGAEIVRSAVGMRVRLWDQTDWRLNRKALDCVLSGLQPAPPPLTPPLGDGLVSSAPPLSLAEQRYAQTCFADHLSWNASQSALGTALAVRSVSGNLDETEFDAAMAWWGAAFPLGKLQLLVSTRYTYRTHQNVVPIDITSRHLTGIGAGLEFRAGKVGFLTEAAMGIARQAGESSLNGLLGITGRFRLKEGIWLETSFQADIEAGDSPGKLLAFSNLKFSYDLIPSLVR